MRARFPTGARPWRRFGSAGFAPGLRRAASIALSPASLVLPQMLAALLSLCSSCSRFPAPVFTLLLPRPRLVSHNAVSMATV